MIGIIVATTKKNSAVGYIVMAYYAIYILIELSEFGLTFGNVFDTYEKFLNWYVVCMAMTCVFVVAMCVAYINQGGFVGAYIIWMIFECSISGAMSVTQYLETNFLLFVYNAVQNINLLMDFAVVFFCTDHFLKRQYSGLSDAIDNINNKSDNWIGFGIHTSKEN